MKDKLKELEEKLYNLNCDIIVRQTDIGILNKKLDKLTTSKYNNVLISLLFLAGFCGFSFSSAIFFTINPIIICGLITTGVSLGALQLNGFLIDRRIKKIKNKIQENFEELDKDDKEFENVNKIVEIYDRENNLRNGLFVGNKQSIVKNNHVINTQVELRNKKRTLSLNKKHNIRN